MDTNEFSGVRRISANLPYELIKGVDQLKKEWGLRSRGAVLERLLEDIFDKDQNHEEQILLDLSNDETPEEINDESKNELNEDKAIVLVGNNNILIKDKYDNQNLSKDKNFIKKNVNQSTGIDLPGFVSSKTRKIRSSLNPNKSVKNDLNTSIFTIKESDILNSILRAKEHWFSLYGQRPNQNVIEASMIWLARDIWPHVDGSENIPFTWSAANTIITEYCPSWNFKEYSFELVIVFAGILEDPFSSSNLEKRVPTIIRRFVNKFKRLQNVTSFQTIESTMTVIGALKLLGLPTHAGSSLTLSTIRDGYKTKALENHPDAGGSTELMRKLNEAYQLLKDLYKEK